MTCRSSLSAALSNATKKAQTLNEDSALQSPLFHTADFGTAVLITEDLNFQSRLFTSLLASFSLFSLDLRLDPLGLIWLAALVKKALLSSHSGSCGTEKEGFYINRNTTLFAFFLFVFQVIIFQCISRLPTSSLGLSWLFRRPPLVPEGAALGVLTHLNGAAQTSSSPLSAS